MSRWVWGMGGVVVMGVGGRWVDGGWGCGGGIRGVLVVRLHCGGGWEGVGGIIGLIFSPTYAHMYFLSIW